MLSQWLLGKYFLARRTVIKFYGKHGEIYAFGSIFTLCCVVQGHCLAQQETSFRIALPLSSGNPVFPTIREMDFHVPVWEQSINSTTHSGLGSSLAKTTEEEKTHWCVKLEREIRKEKNSLEIFQEKMKHCKPPNIWQYYMVCIEFL